MKMMKRKKRMPSMGEMLPHPLLLCHHLLHPPAAAPKEINKEGVVEVIPEQEAPVLYEVILADAEPEMLQLRLYHALMWDYEEDPLRMEDDFDDLDDALTWTSGFPKMEVMIGIGSLSLSLKFRFKNKFF
jgi:hypothetical protein